MNSPVVLRTVRAEVIEGADAVALQDALNVFFQDGGRRTFLTAFMIAAFTMLVLYSEG
jgi:hypothetical protein